MPSKITSHQNGDTVNTSATFAWTTDDEVKGYRLLVGRQANDGMWHHSGDLPNGNIGIHHHSCTGWPTGFPIIVTLQWWGNSKSGSDIIWVKA